MVAAVRLRRLQRDSDCGIELEWRSFLLRPHPRSQTTIEQFRAYTQSWRRCAAEEPEARFRTWSTDENPPTHSIPPHLVAKAAAAVGPGAFESIHAALLQAYFTDNRDISDQAVLFDLWSASGLEDADFERAKEPSVLAQVMADHREALDHGASGVPAVRAADRFGVLMGAQPVEVYRQWIKKLDPPV